MFGSLSEIWNHHQDSKYKEPETGQDRFGDPQWEVGGEQDGLESRNRELMTDVAGNNAFIKMHTGHFEKNLCAPTGAMGP